jgi:enoyl-CoA hydratase/carnithine racemase
MKAQIWTAADNGYDAAFAAADLEQGRCTQTDDFKEGVGSYVTKRPPVFTGR